MFANYEKAPQIAHYNCKPPAANIVQEQLRREVIALDGFKICTSIAVYSTAFTMKEKRRSSHDIELLKIRTPLRSSNKFHSHISGLAMQFSAATAQHRKFV